MTKLRRDICQGFKNEFALSYQRMWNLQVELVDNLIAEEQNIKIDRPWPIPLRRGYAANFHFRFSQRGE